MDSWPSDPQAQIQTPVKEVEVQHRCVDWLERRDCSAQVGVNLCPDTQDPAASVPFDPAQGRQRLGNAVIKLVTQPDGVRTLYIAKHLL
jgi:hypothetical protein